MRRASSVGSRRHAAHRCADLVSRPGCPRASASSAFRHPISPATRCRKPSCPTRQHAARWLDVAALTLGLAVASWLSLKRRSRRGDRHPVARVARLFRLLAARLRVRDRLDPKRRPRHRGARLCGAPGGDRVFHAAPGGRAGLGPRVLCRRLPARRDPGSGAGQAAQGARLARRDPARAAVDLSGAGGAVSRHRQAVHHLQVRPVRRDLPHGRAAQHAHRRGRVAGAVDVRRAAVLPLPLPLRRVVRRGGALAPNGGRR